MSVSVVGFCGSRSLPASFAPLVERVVRSCVAEEVPFFSVGCSQGADALALSSLLSVRVGFRVRVFAVCAVTGQGASRFSALSLVRSVAQRGVFVHWLAGGPLSLPVSSRLFLRTRSFVQSLSSSGALCAFVSSPSSVGSFRACQLAASRGVQVFVFPCGFAPHLLPAFAPGSWVPVISGPFAGSFQWSPSALL